MLSVLFDDNRFLGNGGDRHTGHPCHWQKIPFNKKALWQFTRFVQGN